MFVLETNSLVLGQKLVWIPLLDSICVRHLKPFKYTSYLSLCACGCLVYFIIHNFSSTNNLFNYRTTSKPPGNITDLDVSKSSQLSPTLTVSSNFEVHSPMVYYLCLLMVWLLFVHVLWRGFPFFDFYTISLSVSVLNWENPLLPSSN